MAERGQDGNAQPDWNGALGVSWVAHADAIDTLWEPFGKRTIDALAPRPGDSVLDIGCGAGATTIEIARRVAPRGRSLGVDLSGPLLELAARRAKTAQVSNATFEQADAATGALGGPHDAAFSRFGVMFFDDPVGGFAHIGSALRSGARVAFACWQGREHNAWNTAVYAAAATVVDLPPPAKSREPGGMMFAEPDYARAVLTDAGFVDVGFEPYTENVALPGAGDALHAATEMAEILPSVANAVRGADEATVARVHEAIAAAIEPHRDGGAFRLAAAIWVITATKP